MAEWLPHSKGGTRTRARRDMSRSGSETRERAGVARLCQPRMAARADAEEVGALAAAMHALEDAGGGAGGEGGSEALEDDFVLAATMVRKRAG